MCPSAADLSIALGPTNPALIDIEQETLVFRREGFSPSLWLLVPTFLLRNAPAWVTPSPSQQMRILSYRSCEARASQKLKVLKVCKVKCICIQLYGLYNFMDFITRPCFARTLNFGTMFNPDYLRRGISD